MTLGDFFRGLVGVARATQARKPATAIAGAAVVIAAATPFITGWEGLDLVAKHYAHDPAGVVTYCQGLTNFDNPTVKVGDHFTPSVCDAKFANVLPKYYTQLLRQVPNVVNYPTSFQVSQLSVIYNIGEGNYSTSSMKRYILNGEPKKACDSLLKWNRANGVVLKGLTNRRTSERALCLKDL